MVVVVVVVVAVAVAVAAFNLSISVHRRHGPSVVPPKLDHHKSDGNAGRLMIFSCVMMAVEAGADFVKTSTGFSTRGATVEDVRLMKR